MRSLVRIICIVFIIIGIFLISYDVVVKYESNRKEREKIIKVEKEFKIKSKNNIKQIKHTGIIEIPKIHLKSIFNNNVENIDRNIVLLPVSNLYNNVTILAAHSGNSLGSYFKDLHKLKKSDVVYLYFKGYKYEYAIYKYYEEEKDGDISIDDNSNINILVLTTCKSKTKQLVYIAHLNKKQKISNN